MRRTGRWLLAGLVLALNLGCASVMRVDSQVESHARWDTAALPASTASYVFERTPSQAGAALADSQTALETLAAEVLARHGWQASTPLPSASLPAPWRVQVLASTTTLPRAPWDDPRDRVWPRWGVSASNAGVGIQLGGLFSFDMPYYVRKLTLLVRDGSTGRVVYETSAAHDGRWHDSPALWRAMLEAALTGFPAPQPGVQQVNIDIPR